MSSEESGRGHAGEAEPLSAAMGRGAEMPVTDGRSTATAHALGPKADIARWLSPLKRLGEMLHGAACGLTGVCHPQTHVALGGRVMRVQYLLRDRTGDLEAAVALFEEGGQRFMAAVDAALRDATRGYPDDGLLRLTRCAPHLECMRQGVQGLRGGLDAVGEALDAAQNAVVETYGLQMAAPAGTAVVAGARASAEAEHDTALLVDLRRLAGATDGAQVEAAAARVLCHGRVELARMTAALDDLSRHGQTLIEACARLADEIVPAWIGCTAPQGGLAGSPARHDEGLTPAAAQAWAGWQAQMQAMQALREGLHDLLREMGRHYAFNPTPEEGRQAALDWARAWIEQPPELRLPG